MYNATAKYEYVIATYEVVDSSEKIRKKNTGKKHLTHQEMLKEQRRANRKGKLVLNY